MCILCQAQLRTKAPACTKNVATKIVQVLTHLLSTGCSDDDDDGSAVVSSDGGAVEEGLSSSCSAKAADSSVSVICGEEVSIEEIKT